MKTKAKKTFIESKEGKQLEKINKTLENTALKKTFDILSPKEKNLFDILQKNGF